MDVHVVTLKSFHIVGPMITTKLSEDRIGDLWREFGRRRNEIINRVDPYFAFGLSEYSPNPRESFNYIVGFSVQNLDHVPEGMVGRTIPMQEYALFVYTGHRIGEVWKYSDKWLAESEYKRAESADFELYDNRFLDREDGMKTISVYIPITKK